MPYILSIETATKNCSVGISKSGQTIICKEIATEGYSHAEKLHVLIEEILRESKLTFVDLKAIAVSRGPGSYTGLRIGVSAAKGLCFALDIPLIAIDTLAVLAAQVNISEGTIIPMLDARRMEVYSAVFNPNHDMIREAEAEIITEDSYPNSNETIYIVGDCQEKIKTVLNRGNFIFIENVVYPSAKDMSALAFAKFQQKDFEDVAYFEPFYLKDFLVAKPKN
ncbi:MAG TPA: tRNA (adenosine(37)-N6)-threonylcarbamoyltransferase complex dimerization subunit type 1 TsaB [Flavobacterium sp.]|nr:tRNA (adenosine(37)-N6)-threonylcarbamoyltransferase complex dimerization subunit type 1 TsaB [Flavobacterium sp.]